jgi:prephenate dehydrogenase
MTVGIIGLGLIGGSLAKAYKNANHTVLVSDIDKSIEEFAILSKNADGIISTDNCQLSIVNCQLILIALYPIAAVEWLEKNAKFIPKTTTVIDCCGTKKNICTAGFAAAEKYGFTFVGGHPMAGTEQSGFKYSDAGLFNGATMLIVPPESKVNDIEFLDNIKTMLAPAGFGRLTFTTAEKHDELIAFTSQMAHLVSNAFVKSPTVREHKGFSAGSYKDLTRVAWLNEQMWAELFMENQKPLLHELEIFIKSLQEYQAALKSQDFDTLKQLLHDGKALKEEVDRK